MQGRCAHLTQPQPIHLQQGRGHLPGSQHVLARLPVRRVLQLQLHDATRGRRRPATSRCTPTRWCARSSTTRKPQTQRASALSTPKRSTDRLHVRASSSSTRPLSTSTWILLNSVDRGFPTASATTTACSDTYIMPPYYRAGVSGRFEGFEDQLLLRPHGRRDFFIPNFRNLGRHDDLDFVEGYTTLRQRIASDWTRDIAEHGIGAPMKESLTEPGPVDHLHGHAWRDHAYLRQPRSPRTDQKDPWGHPAARHLRELRRQRRDACASDMMHACRRDARSGRLQRPLDPHNHRHLRRATSTRWAASRMGKIRRPRCSTNGTSFRPAERLRHRWRVHGIDRHQPVASPHGADGARGGFAVRELKRQNL